MNTGRHHRRWAWLSLLLLLPQMAWAQLLVWSMGNSQSNTQAVATWLGASGQFSSVTAYDGTDLTNPAVANLQAYQQILFFSNGGGNPALGDTLAQYALTGRRLVLATFVWANQGGNTLGGQIITDAISPVVFTASTLYTNATLGTTDGGAFFSGVSAITGYYRDSVTPTAGAVVHAYWSDNYPLLVSKGNVIAVNLFPDDGYANVSGDYRRLFINALTVAVPEPSTWLLLGLGAGGLLAFRRRPA